MEKLCLAIRVSSIVVYLFGQQSCKFDTTIDELSACIGQQPTSLVCLAARGGGDKYIFPCIL